MTWCLMHRLKNPHSTQLHCSEWLIALRMTLFSYCRLFEAYPDMKEAFPAFRDIGLSELKDSHELRHHSSRYVQLTDF